MVKKQTPKGDQKPTASGRPVRVVYDVGVRRSTNTLFKPTSIKEMLKEIVKPYFKLSTFDQYMKRMSVERQVDTLTKLVSLIAKIETSESKAKQEEDKPDYLQLLLKMNQEQQKQAGNGKN